MLIIKNMIMVMKTIIVELSLVVVAEIVPLYKLSIAVTITLV